MVPFTHTFGRDRFRRSLFLLLPILLSIPVSVKAQDKQVFLYRNVADDVTPIVEYYNATAPNDYIPDFIADKVPYHRIVLFYSPKCPHCVHFKPHYVALAKHMLTLSNDQSQPMFAGLKVKFFAVSCDSYNKICRHQNIKQYPMVKAYEGGGTHAVVVTHDQVQPFQLLKALGEGFVDDNWADKPKKSENNDKNEIAGEHDNSQQSSGYFATRTKAQMYNDAFRAFHTAMKDHVFLEPGPLPGPRKQALQKFLQLVEHVLPPWRLHFLVSELLDDFTNNVEEQELWEQIIEIYPPRRRLWSPGCETHQSPFSCGLWSLFHILTVGLVEYNQHLVNPTHDAKAIQSPKAASAILRDYMQHFFLCQECSAHFVTEFDACAYDGCHRLVDRKNGNINDWQELPLWLWEVHNGINLRLQKERRENQGSTTPQEEQSVVWPSVQECPHCWTQFSGAMSTYNKTMMYQYLRMTYWPDDGITDTTRRALQQASSNKQVPYLTPEAANPFEKMVSFQSVEMITGLNPEEVAGQGGLYALISAVVAILCLMVIWKKIRMESVLERSKTRNE